MTKGNPVLRDAPRTRRGYPPDAITGERHAAKRRLGRSDLTVSALCLGTMTFGQQNTEDEAHDQLDRALAAGINIIDTAEIYPVPPLAETQGRTEQYIGGWLAARGPGQCGSGAVR